MVRGVVVANAEGLLWWSFIRLVLSPIAAGVAVGVLVGSPWLAGVVAGTLLAATYVWRNHLGPARVPRELRPPQR
jgi:hypothetical protein